MPELQEKQLIEWPIHVVKDLGAHDMIIGRDVLTFLGIDILFSRKTVEWNGRELPFKLLTATDDTDYHVEESMAVTSSAERIQGILDAKYEAADLEQVCASQDHLTQDKQRLELKPDATPYHAKPYPVPRVHHETLKMEVERLVRIGVLKKINRSEWAAPSFIIPKKDGTVRFINDFRELNKWI